MGTRSRTEVYDGERCLVSIYRQFDGYPNGGMGEELAEFLKPIQMINGIGAGQNEMGKFANGMGCLAAQLIAHFKDRVGNIYIHAEPWTPDTEAREEYVYRVNGEDGETKPPTVQCFKVEWEPKKPRRLKLMFKGSVGKFAAFCQKPVEPE